MFFIVCLFSAFALVVYIGNRLATQDALNQVQRRKSDLKKNLKLIEKLIWRLDGFQFEEFCSMLFSLNGVKNDVTKKTGDGGKDIILRTKTGRIYVECKHYAPSHLISSPLIMKLVGSCVVDGIDKAIFITTSGYSSEAIKVIDGCKAVVIDRYYINDLLSMASTNSGYVLNWLYQRT